MEIVIVILLLASIFYLCSYIKFIRALRAFNDTFFIFFNPQRIGRAGCSRNSHLSN